MFIFDELGWNFEPSEMGAAFGLQQLKKLPRNYERRQRNFALYNEFFAKHADRIVLPRQTDELDTAWLCYPIIVRPDAGFDRSDLQQFLEQREHRHPHGLDGQRGAPADDEERARSARRRRACPTPIS